MGKIELGVGCMASLLLIFLSLTVLLGLAVAFFGVFIAELSVLIIGLIFAFLFCVPLVNLLRHKYVTAKKAKAVLLSPTLTSPVKVHSKTSQLIVGIVAFQFPSGECKNFRLPIDSFNVLIVGETGMLTYREYNGEFFFLRFQP